MYQHRLLYSNNTSHQNVVISLLFYSHNSLLLTTIHVHCHCTRTAYLSPLSKEAEDAVKCPNIQTSVCVCLTKTTWSPHCSMCTCWSGLVATIVFHRELET